MSYARHWLESKQVTGVMPMNKGGTQKLGGIQVTMVHADHSCGILDDGRIIYGGEAVSYVIRFEDGYTAYFAGDTNVFGDVRIIGELYKPDVACRSEIFLPWARGKPPMPAGC